MLTGENGILNEAKTARENTIKAEEKEKVEIAANGVRAKELGGDITKEKLDIELNSIIGEGKYESEDTEEGVTVSYINSGRSYLVDRKGKVSEIEIVKDPNPGNLEGDGSESNPYQINSLDDYSKFARDSENGETYEGKYIVLNLDLVFEKGAYPIIGEDTSKEGIVFLGNFDGKGHVLKDIKVKSTELSGYKAVFGTNGGTIENLGVENIQYSLSSTDDDAGPYASIVANNEGIIRNCYAKNSTVKAAVYVAGIAGYNEGTIENCYNLCELQGLSLSDDTGWNEACFGGIVGENEKGGKIRNCYNFGNIDFNIKEGQPDYKGYIGGIAGYNEGTIENCYNLGKVTSLRNYVGGITGQNKTSESIITNCYNAGIIEGKEPYASIAGGNLGTITSCFFKKGTAQKGIGEGEGEAVEQEELPSVLEVINGDNSFKVEEGINNGYPILNWE